MNIKNEVNYLQSLKKCNSNLINLSFPLQTGAEDLRMKMEMRQLQSPLASSAPPTPTIPVMPYSSNKGIPVGLEGTIAPADMLNVLSAHRESVNTADGKDQPSSTDDDSHALAAFRFVLIGGHELTVWDPFSFYFLFLR